MKLRNSASLMALFLATCCLLLFLSTLVVGIIGTETPSLRYVHLDDGLKLDVLIGTPPQPFKLLFNTGSSGTWVISSEFATRTRRARREPGRFDPGQSSSWAPDPRRWATFYHIGAKYSGTLARDQMLIGGILAGTPPIRDQLFGLANEATGYLVDRIALNGTIGVGDRLKMVVDADDPIETMFQQQLIPQEMFSLHVSPPAAPGRPISNGTLVLGGLDSRHYTGDIHYVPIVSRWEFQMDYVRVEGSPFGDSTEHQGVKAVARLDSSSNIIVGPHYETRALIDSLDHSRLNLDYGLYELPSCRKAQKSRTKLVISIGGRKFELRMRDLIIKLLISKQETCFLALRDMTEDHLASIGLVDYWVLGTPFMKRYYTIYDYAHQRVGFANSTNAH